MGERELVSMRGGHAYQDFPFMGLVGDIPQEKGAKRRKWGRTGQDRTGQKLSLQQCFRLSLDGSRAQPAPQHVPQAVASAVALSALYENSCELWCEGRAPPEAAALFQFRHLCA